jgi:thioesterase domain-containing protein
LTPPADALELQLQTIWEELLNVRPIGVLDSFFELGGHSLMAVRLLARLRNEIDPGLALATLLHAPTIRQLAGALRSGGSWRPSPLVPLQPRGAAPPFFCVHGGWGDVLCYGRLARRLGEDQPLYGLQAIEHTPVSVGQLAGLNLEAIRAVQPHGPYRLGGWSFGGVVAYDMACQLRARGEDVESLVLIDAVPPGAPPWNFAAVLTTMTEQLRRVPWLVGADHDSPAEGAQWLTDAARRARLHHEALQAYSPPSCDVRSLLVRAGEGLEASPYDPLEAWRPFLSIAPDVRHAGGNHFNMLEEPHVASVALAVREFFALTGSPPGQVAG